jgi:membrane protein YdbS with pleckstrin-like domain
MENQGTFLVKLLLLSAVLSGVIKYFVPLLDIPATPAVVMALVVSPTLLLTGALAWRYWQAQSQQDKL